MADTFNRIALIKSKVRDQLAADLPERWYYIPIARPGQFLGGVYVRARGDVVAWSLIHQAGLDVVDTVCGVPVRFDPLEDGTWHTTRD